MNKLIPGRAGLALLLSLIAGACAVWAARQYLKEHAQAIEEGMRTPMVQRIVAGEDLAPGTLLTYEHLAYRDFPNALVPGGSMAPERLHEVIGKTIRTALWAGDAVLDAHLQVTGPQALSARLAPGRRAITLPVDALNAQAGLVQPGDLIDLYVSFNHQRRRITAPLLQGALILATGTQLDTQDAFLESDVAGSYATITLDATPEDAVRLVAARETGVLTAILRAPGDAGTSSASARSDLADLVGMALTERAQARRPKVIYGNQGARNLPALGAAAEQPQQARGLFYLPHSPSLATAWTMEGPDMTGMSSTSAAWSREMSHELAEAGGEAVP